MADEIIKRDGNFVTVLAGVTNDANQYITMLRVDPTSKRLLVSVSGSGSGFLLADGSVTGATGQTQVFTNTLQITALTASQLIATDASKNLVSLAVATYPSLTELSYVKGVTSGIQSQLNGKQASGSYLLADGSVAGATSQSQTFTNGINTGLIIPISDSTSAVKITKADGTTGIVFVDSTNGFVGIGMIPITSLSVLTTTSADPRGIANLQISTDNLGARVGFFKARGTPATPTTIVTGDILGRLMFRGYDGTNYLEMGSIDVMSMGTIGTGRIPTKLVFRTATDAATSVLTDRLEIDDTGAGQWFSQYYSTEYTDTIVAGAATIDWNNGNAHYIVLGNGTNTLTLANPKALGRYLLIVKQPPSGAAGTVTFSPVPLWSGGSAPTLTTSNNAIDYYTFAYSTALTKYLGAANLSNS